MLTGAFFMLEIYDRVLPSRSVPTLVGLVVLAASLFAAHGRARPHPRRASWCASARALDEALSGRVYETLIVRLPLKAGNRSDGLQPLRDLDNVRSFLSGIGPDRVVRPALDAALSRHLLHVPSLIGLAALLGAIMLAVTHAADRDDAPASRRSATAHRGMPRNGARRDRASRNAEALTAMGMAGRIAARWGDANRQYMASQREASDVAGGLGSISKMLRMMLQSARARGRRLAGDQPAGHRRHHHRRLDPVARARSRRSISPSPTGEASSPRARAGSG